MRFRITLTGIVCLILFPIFFVSCAHDKRPPKPGPDFVWVAAHVSHRGVAVPGHWKYVGPGVKGKTWVPGHHGVGGKWVSGHWKTIIPPKEKAVWIKGHYGPGGKWLPGHWR